MTHNDEKLSAWIDGALGEDEERELSGMAAQDAGIAERASQLRRIDELLRTAVPEEPVPQDLLERLGLAGSVPSSADESNVVDFAAERSCRIVAPVAQTQRPTARFWDNRKVAALLALVGVGLTSALLLDKSQPSAPQANYRVLGDAPQAAASANALVMFSGDVDAAKAGEIAASVGARIAGGQTPSGAWKLAIDPAGRDAALGRLRRRGDVVLAEPIGDTAP